jgi:hypothetical protein
LFFLFRPSQFATAGGGWRMFATATAVKENMEKVPAFQKIVPAFGVFQERPVKKSNSQ